MKHAAFVAMVFVMVFAGSVVWAQCPTTTVCPPLEPAQVTCPAPAPVATCPAPAQVTVCPAPAQVTCPAVAQVCPCPASVPAAVGAGPAGDLQGLQCPDFDPAYASEIYSHNTVIATVTEYGAQRAGDRNLRDISREINSYVSSANQKIADTYGLSGCAPLAADCDRAQAIIAELSTQTGECFDVAYAKTLSTLLRQSNTADGLAMTQLANPQLRDQAQFMAEKTDNWAFRLDRWVTDNGYVA